MLALQEDDLGQALLLDQLGLHVLEGQRQVRQNDLQALGQGRLGHRRTAHEGQAAGLEPARVHAEELIILPARQQPPQARIGRGRDARIGLAQQLRIDPGLEQDSFGRSTRRTTLQQGFAHHLQ
ncbi:hypothetical protein D3C85_1337500 [compost metagenome]